MKDEIIKELNEERKSLEIPKDKFLKMLKYALEYQKTNPSMSYEEVVEIIRATMYSYDYAVNFENYEGCMDLSGIKSAYGNRKSVGESFIVALNVLGHINQYENKDSRVK